MNPAVPARFDFAAACFAVDFVVDSAVGFVAVGFGVSVGFGVVVGFGVAVTAKDAGLGGPATSAAWISAAVIFENIQIATTPVIITICLILLFFVISTSLQADNTEIIA